MCYWTRAIDLQSEFRALRRMHSPAAHAPGAAPPGPTMLSVALFAWLWFYCSTPLPLVLVGFGPVLYMFRGYAGFPPPWFVGS